MPRMADTVDKRHLYYTEQATSSNVYTKKNYKLDLFIIHGSSKKERKRFLQMKEPYVKDAWLRMENNQCQEQPHSKSEKPA